MPETELIIGDAAGIVVVGVGNDCRNSCVGNEARGPADCAASVDVDDAGNDCRNENDDDGADDEDMNAPNDGDEVKDANARLRGLLETLYPIDEVLLFSFVTLL